MGNLVTFRRLVNVGKFLADKGSFSFLAPSKGKHKLEIRYVCDDEFES